MEKEFKTEVEKLKNVKFGLYVIYDSVSEITGPIFEAINIPTAIRQYNVVTQGSSDYELWYLGNREQVSLAPVEPQKIDTEKKKQVKDKVVYMDTHGADK